MDNILIVDDEKNLLLVLEDLLAGEGYRVLTADLAEKGLELAISHDLDVVITDMKMPGMDGIALLEKIHEVKPDLPVIMLTAFGSIERAVEAMRKGAFNYVCKPFKNEELKVNIRKAIDQYKILCQNRYLSQELQERFQFSSIIGKNIQMQRIYQLIEKVAPTKATILITGESGTGKELIAKAIHFNSTRRDKPFISVNCGALPETLLESELFGHEKGSFSGAINQRKGRFELADEGTLFLDEISEMSAPLQVKLLRVLQEMEFERVGGSQSLRVDVRVVAASNRNLKQEMAESRFRGDLFYRLNVVHIELPALRERVDDIPLLVNHFLSKFGLPGERSLPIQPEALRALLDYQWPGNVRELENVIERAVILSNGQEITFRDLPADVREPRAPTPVTARDASSSGNGELVGSGQSSIPAPSPFDPGERFPDSGFRLRQIRALQFIADNGCITNKHYSRSNEISERQALRELNEMVDSGKVLRIGKGRACRYVMVGVDDVQAPNLSESISEQ